MKVDKWMFKCKIFQLAPIEGTGLPSDLASVLKY